MVFCLLAFSACKSNENCLTGTKWKLVGIVDSPSKKLTAVEPTDCEECYTITFDTDSTAAVHVISSTFKLNLSNLNPYVNFETILKYENYNDNSYEISSFTMMVIAAASYTVSTKQLRLYDLGGDYLLFKPVQIK